MPGCDPQGMRSHNAPSGSPYCVPDFSAYQVCLIGDDLLGDKEVKRVLEVLIKKAKTLHDSVHSWHACDFDELVDSLYGGKVSFERLAGSSKIVDAAERDLNVIATNREEGFAYWQRIHEYSRKYGRVIVGDTYGNLHVDQKIGDAWENAPVVGWARCRRMLPTSRPKWRSIVGLSLPRDGRECICHDGKKIYLGRRSMDAFCLLTQSKLVRGQIWMPFGVAVEAR